MKGQEKREEGLRGTTEKCSFYNRGSEKELRIRLCEIEDEGISSSCIAVVMFQWSAAPADAQLARLSFSVAQPRFRPRQHLPAWLQHTSIRLNPLPMSLELRTT